MRLNVAFGTAEAPDPNATSLLMLASPIFDRNMLVRAVIQALGARLEKWCAPKGPTRRSSRTTKGTASLFGARVRASLPGDRQLDGETQTIDELGRLRITTEAGF
jgi:BirA family biotin operon repressor/biotin-[acetyl-CoA-carboxylase] ligase